MPIFLVIDIVIVNYPTLPLTANQSDWESRCEPVKDGWTRGVNWW